VKFIKILFPGILLLLVGFVPPSHIRKNPNPTQGKPRVSIFDVPRFEAQRSLLYRQIYILLDKKDYNRAEAMLRKWATQFPKDHAAPYDLACVHALRGQKEEAFYFLKKSVRMGFRDTKHIEADKDLISLREDPRFQEILETSRQPFQPRPILDVPKAIPAVPENGKVLITKENLGYDSRTRMFVGLIENKKSEINNPVTTRNDRVGKLLRKWYKEDTAAGNAGDFYDNHDSDHSNLSYKQYPQLTRIEYGEEIRKRNLHYGLQNHLVFNSVVLGNSSTAQTNGALWRSQARHAITTPGGAAKLAIHYRANHLYFYPEHRDHDPGRNGKEGGGYGDVFPANTPYIVISQGSSGSDRVFMDAFAATLAALRPETKTKLAKAGLLGPTLQMIFRRTSKNLKEDGDYFSGKAHPTVFQSKNLDVEKMIQMAHDLRPDKLPPLAQFIVTGEIEEQPGRDYFDISPRQRLFNTPHAIARVHKTTARDYRITLSAETSADLDSQALTYKWTVLRGDKNRIKIETKGPNDPIAKITVPWHNRRAINPGAKIQSNRVDIGLFVFNKNHWSTPAIFSIYHPDNQERSYDKSGRIKTVTYDPSIYTDPRIDAPADWTDTYNYEKGKLMGWSRKRKDQPSQEFTPEGRLIIEKDASGNPTRTTGVRYVPKRLENGSFRLEQESLKGS